eukprot:TRINITY_DN1974_c0_g1_i1.p2 TRINITY_DN1974_c0_g1~~TRINITY_DN1974_c0_g1_i1.p2  ORF type:complete len:139 (+),score=9.72 TRINITY_DN1974_c0_g1_i1:195-611(+)
MSTHTGGALLLDPTLHEHYVQKPKLFKWRWVVLAVFCALQAFCSVVQMSFIGIMKQATAWYVPATGFVVLTPAMPPSACLPQPGWLTLLPWPTTTQLHSLIAVCVCAHVCTLYLVLYLSLSFSSPPYLLVWPAQVGRR